jgi:hypothetical protein
VGAATVGSQLDFVIFFWDPLEPHPHDVDVKALSRIAVVYSIPIACNRLIADFLMPSPLMHRLSLGYFRDFFPQRAGDRSPRRRTAREIEPRIVQLRHRMVCQCTEVCHRASGLCQ